MKIININFHTLNRRIHLYSGLFMIPYIFIFGVSGFLFNHPTAFNNRTFDSFELNNEAGFNSLFPNIEKIAYSVTDSLRKEKHISNVNIENIKYTNTMILRNKNQHADYRMEVDIPTSKIRVVTLPDFVDNSRVHIGNYNIKHGVTPESLVAKAEKILEQLNRVPGASVIQRVPNIEFDIKNKDINYRIQYNLMNGNYSATDLKKRKFKLNYMLINLHELHGYPVSGFSIQWLWVFFADSLAILMIVWAVSGLIMWFKMKRLFTVGTILLTISILIIIMIVLNNNELGY